MLLPSALGFSPHPPVSVYGTGTVQTIAAFLGSRLTHFPTLVRYASHLWVARRFFQPYPSCACPWIPFQVVLSFCVPTVLSYCSTGISTCCPSATPLGLALGPDLPRADQLYSGNLGYSAWRIPTSISLLIPAFSLPYTPQLLTVLLPRVCNAPLPIQQTLNSSASVSCFSPGHFRRRTSRPVSYYALFECMAASEPTSWLSLKSHILFHLTRTLGP